MIKLPGWWTPREVANLYRVHTETIYRWIRKGKLPATRISRNLYRIRLEDVLALTDPKETLADLDEKLGPRVEALRRTLGQKGKEKGPPVTAADIEAAAKAVRAEELDEQGHLRMGEGE